MVDDACGPDEKVQGKDSAVGSAFSKSSTRHRMRCPQERSAGGDLPFRFAWSVGHFGGQQAVRLHVLPNGEASHVHVSRRPPAFLLFGRGATSGRSEGRVCVAKVHIDPASGAAHQIARGIGRRVVQQRNRPRTLGLRGSLISEFRFHLADAGAVDQILVPKTETIRLAHLQRSSLFLFSCKKQ
jgi:hypothetical protein